MTNFSNRIITILALPEFETKEQSFHVKDYEKCYHNISHSPDRAAFIDLKDIETNVNSIYHACLNHIASYPSTIDQVTILMNDFINTHIPKHLDYITNKVRLASAMIVGPANFPVDRMRKRQKASWKRHDKIVSHHNSYLKRLSRILPSRDEQLDQLRKDLAIFENYKLHFNEINSLRKKYFQTDRSDAVKSELLAADKSLVDYVGHFDLILGCPVTRPSLNNKIRMLEKRIKQLSEPAVETKAYVLKGGVEVQLVQNIDLERIQLIFNLKPDEEMRQTLKGSAFRWSPRNKAWQRKLTVNGINAAQTWIFNHTPKDKGNSYDDRYAARLEEMGFQVKWNDSGHVEIPKKEHWKEYEQYDLPKSWHNYFVVAQCPNDQWTFSTSISLVLSGQGYGVGGLRSSFPDRDSAIAAAIEEMKLLYQKYRTDSADGKEAKRLLRILSQLKSDLLTPQIHLFD